MKTYVAVKKGLPIGEAMDILKRAVISTFSVFKDRPEIETWLNNPELTVLEVNQDAINKLKSITDHMVITNDKNEEVGIFFLPRTEWPTYVGFLPRYGGRFRLVENT